MEVLTMEIFRIEFKKNAQYQIEFALGNSREEVQAEFISTFNIENTECIHVRSYQKNESMFRSDYNHFKYHQTVGLVKDLDLDYWKKRLG